MIETRPHASQAPLAAGIASIVAAPAPAIIVGFQAAAGDPVSGVAAISAVIGVALGVAAIRGTRAGARGARAARVLGSLAVGGAAFGFLFYLLVLIAPSQDGLQGALVGPAGFLVAFLVGMISFFSPCILPLLPGYLSFVSGLSGEEIGQAARRGRVVAGTSLFVLGFATVFTGFGASATAIGGFLGEHEDVFNRVAGIIVILMGVAFALPRLLGVLEKESRPLMSRVRPGVGGAYPLGLAFAVGWTPCIGPGLGAILTLGAFQESVGRGALLLFFFSLGFGVWFILAGLGMRGALGASSWLRRHTRGLQAVGGAFMIAIGVLLVTDLWDNLISPIRRLIVNFAPPV